MFLVTIKESPVEGEMLNYFHIETISSVRKLRKLSSDPGLCNIFSLSTFYKCLAVLNRAVSPGLFGILDSTHTYSLMLSCSGSSP